MALLEEAKGYFLRVLELDPEAATAHYNLDLIYKQLGDKEKAATHFKLYQKYKTDDNARDRAVVIARSKDPAADHAAEAIVIYDLRREGAFELGENVGVRRAALYGLRPPTADPPSPRKGRAVVAGAVGGVLRPALAEGPTGGLSARRSSIRSGPRPGCPGLSLHATATSSRVCVSRS